MRTPRTSIIMPVYNTANTVINAIQSVRNQTDPNFELLIMIDGSPMTPPTSSPTTTRKTPTPASTSSTTPKTKASLLCVIRGLIMHEVNG